MERLRNKTGAWLRSLIADGIGKLKGRLENGFASPQRQFPDVMIAITLIEPAHHNWLVHRDLAEDLSILEVIKDNGCYRIEEIDLEVTSPNWDLAFPRNFI
ncbi:hypothetical protein CLH62_00580 [Marinobacter guineae]|uniref:Uncharacterized protein n=1 Tax=Marinobacter guineae TaxID=432303 RepID=A0A2G1VHZ6_9GAMM|nr:hypothetical protein [Marinobacter guineae]PHQ26139.1 hypothetical protein CLH62_00580 [Marinobacter guineae]